MCILTTQLNRTKIHFLGQRGCFFIYSCSSLLMLSLPASYTTEHAQSLGFERGRCALATFSSVGSGFSPGERRRWAIRLIKQTPRGVRQNGTRWTGRQKARTQRSLKGMEAEKCDRERDRENRIQANAARTHSAVDSGHPLQNAVHLFPELKGAEDSAVVELQVYV